MVRVEAGVLLNDLAEDAQKQGTVIIRQIQVEKFATLGGNVSTNSRNDMRAVKYGLYQRLCQSHDGRTSNR